MACASETIPAKYWEHEKCEHTNELYSRKAVESIPFRRRTGHGSCIGARAAGEQRAEDSPRPWPPPLLPVAGLVLPLPFASVLLAGAPPAASPTPCPPPHAIFQSAKLTRLVALTSTEQQLNLRRGNGRRRQANAQRGSVWGGAHDTETHQRARRRQQAHRATLPRHVASAGATTSLARPVKSRSPAHGTTGRFAGPLLANYPTKHTKRTGLRRTDGTSGARPALGATSEAKGRPQNKDATSIALARQGAGRGLFPSCLFSLAGRHQLIRRQCRAGRRSWVCLLLRGCVQPRPRADGLGSSLLRLPFPPRSTAAATGFRPRKATLLSLC